MVGQIFSILFFKNLYKLYTLRSEYFFFSGRTDINQDTIAEDSNDQDIQRREIN